MLGEVCGEDDPTCRKFGFDHYGQPTEMMAASFLYKAVKHNMEGVQLDPKLFKEAGVRGGTRDLLYIRKPSARSTPRNMA